MAHLPPFLKPGAKITIVATARKVVLDDIKPFEDACKQKGFEVYYSPELFQTDFQFAGTDLHRQQQLQKALDDPDTSVIWCARGGYGTVRILDGLNWDLFKKYPKWIIGFSDVTALHAACLIHSNFASLHAPMVVNFPQGPLPQNNIAWDAIWAILKGQLQSYLWPNSNLFVEGSCSGELVGGNLSVMMSIGGSTTDFNLNNKILFLEDLDEYRYHLNRMFQWLGRRKDFPNLLALLGGTFSDMKDLNPTNPFGQDAEEMMAELNKNNLIPMATCLPFGHGSENMPMIQGGLVELNITKNNVQLQYII